MKPYSELTREELLALRDELRSHYQTLKGLGLNLNMSRGKPCKEQLALSMGMLDVLKGDSILESEDGTDCRNYGGLTGIPEAKRLMGDMMEAPSDQVLLYGNSSLNLMYDTVSRAYTHGVLGGTPWCKLDQVRFLCVVPGYDRHFAITEHFGIENVPVPMGPEGPDMDLVERLVSEDASVKGIWCVPKYSNPSGNSYSDETVRRLAALKPAAKDFRIYWDNAYTIHHLYDEAQQDTILEILSECEKAGNPDLVYKFGSTSKICFPGSGISALATSKHNLKDMEKQMKSQTIGHDKINQLRHVRFFGDIQGIRRHMQKHADILRPKFEAVNEILERELGGLGIGSWTKPRGGYFVSFDTLEGCAKAVVSRCAEAGVVMTQAGATWPGGRDPRDSNIRIAPSFPSLSDLKTATELFALCVKYVSAEKLLEQR